jgi:hypothetical protein
MIFQWFLRGVSDRDGTLDEEWAKRVLETEGLRSAWLRANTGSDPAEWDRAVNHHESLLWHVNRFDDLGFPGWPAVRYGGLSPFLSLSSGTVEPDHRARRNAHYPAWFTAIWFATSHGHADGWVFYGYASVLGRPALPLLEFSEEVRDLHQHDFYNPYHPEGEVAAKILVPPVRLKQAFRVTADLLWEWRESIESAESADREDFPETPRDDALHLLAKLSDRVLPGGAYRAPEEFSNIRDIK